MAIITITLGERGVDYPTTGFGTCCGIQPYAYHWPRKKLIAVMCSNPKCDLHGDGGVLCGEREAIERWDRFRKDNAAATVAD